MQSFAYPDSKVQEIEFKLTTVSILLRYSEDIVIAIYRIPYMMMVH